MFLFGSLRSALGSHPEWLHTAHHGAPQVPDVLYNNMASLSRSAPLDEDAWSRGLVVPCLLASPDLTDFDHVMVVSAWFHACGALPQACRASVHVMVPRRRLHSLHERILYRYIQSHGPQRARIVRAVAVRS